MKKDQQKVMKFIALLCHQAGIAVDTGVVSSATGKMYLQNDFST